MFVLHSYMRCMSAFEWIAENAYVLNVKHALKHVEHTFYQMRKYWCLSASFPFVRWQEYFILKVIWINLDDCTCSFIRISFNLICRQINSTNWSRWNWFDRCWCMTGNTSKNHLVKWKKKHFSVSRKDYYYLSGSFKRVFALVSVCVEHLSSKSISRCWMFMCVWFPLTSSHHKNQWNVKIVPDPIVPCLVEFHGISFVVVAGRWW